MDRKEVKQGIDGAATQLKNAVDKVAAKTAETSQILSEKARKAGRKTGEQMIKQGQKLRDASR